MPRVSDGRAGVCNRAGLLGWGLGTPVNRYKQCQMWQAGSGARCWGRWGGIRVRNCIFWG